MSRRKTLSSEMSAEPQACPHQLLIKAHPLISVGEVTKMDNVCALEYCWRHFTRVNISMIGGDKVKNPGFLLVLTVSDVHQA